MKLLFLVPPNVENTNVLRDSVYGCWCKGNRLGGAMTPPHPLLLLATCAKTAGHDVYVIDGQIDPSAPITIRENIRDTQAVIIQTSVMAFNDDCNALDWLKELNPEIMTIVCGSMPTFLPEQSLEPASVDYIILGEAEEVLLELLRKAESLQDPGDLRGIGYKTDRQRVVNCRAPLIDNLDKLPVADWTLLDHGQEYFNPIIKRHPYVTELTTRGCFAKCVFCMSPGFYGGKIRGQSAEYVIDALRQYASLGYREIYFRDEMFTSLRNRNLEIYETMIKDDIDLTWICSSRVNAVNEKDLRLMKRAGCHWIKFGVESGSQAILDKSKKGITLDETREAFRLCRITGIKTHAHFMIGNPGDTLETVDQTIAFAREIKPTTATFGMLMIYPGTPLWDELALRKPELARNFEMRLEDLHTRSFYTDEFTEMTEEQLHAAVKKAHRSFFMRPGYLAQRLLDVRSVNEFKTLFRAGAKVIDFSVKGSD